MRSINFSILILTLSFSVSSICPEQNLRPTGSGSNATLLSDRRLSIPVARTRHVNDNRISSPTRSTSVLVQARPQQTLTSNRETITPSNATLALLPRVRPPIAAHRLHHHSHQSTPMSGNDHDRASRRPTSALTVTNKPKAQQEPDDSQRSLCIIRLYVDALINGRARQNDQVDMNDRIAFFIPLIIIYWRHRHPREPLPFEEIDNLLAEVGEEAELHRRILQDMVKKVEQQCVQNNDNNKYFARQRDQKKAAYALRILRDWLDESKKFEDRDSLPTTRQSGAREIRVWFESLVNLNKKAATSSVDRVRLDPNRLDFTYTSTALPPTSTTLTSVAPIRQVNRPPFNRQNEPGSGGETPSETNGGVTAILATNKEPYGWPHYNRSTTTEPSNLQTAVSTPSYSSETSVTTELFNVTLVNQLRDLGSVLSSNSRLATDSLGVSQYGEFFEMVSSIIDEINNIHNSTRTLATESASDLIF